jgi:hypothetical protein
MNQPDCAALCVPEELIQGSRTSFKFDPESEELLFRRIKLGAEELAFPLEGQPLIDLLASNLPMKSDSYNRSFVSNEPQGVLYSDRNSNCNGPHHADDHIVIQVAVSTLYLDAELTQHIVEANLNQPIRLRPVHSPLPCNYAHTDLIAEIEEPAGRWTSFEREIRPPGLKRIVRLFLMKRVVVTQV